MAEPLRPAATKLFARQNWVFVPSIANTAAPTATGINAASAIDITNIVFADSAPAVTQNTNVVDQNRRFGDTTTSQFIGTTTYGGGEMTYQFNPQGAAAGDSVKLWEKWLNVSGATVTGFLVRRMGIAKATSTAAGDFVDIYPVEIGPSMPTSAGDGEASEAAAVATFAVTGAPVFKVAVV